MPTRFLNVISASLKGMQMQLHELFSATGEIWFKKGSYYYTLGQVQTIMRDAIRTQPENAETIFQGFHICQDPPKYPGKSKTR
jgi:hypothetical protein